MRALVKVESNFNPNAVSRKGAMGLMQIKHATARGVGYTGPASGLLDPETNLTYAVRYLAGAFRAANGNADRAVSYFRSGYYRPKHQVQRAVAQAALHPVRLKDLQQASGEYIAKKLRCEGAVVTSGASAALTLATAACIASAIRLSSIKRYSCIDYQYPLQIRTIQDRTSSG